MAAVVWLCGPPCRPGKTALSSALACSAVLMIMAPRGPRRVLWVVVVMTSACPTGRRVRAAGDQAGDVRDVGDQDRADLAGDLGERREVDGARDRGAAAEDDLRPLGERQVADLVHVDPAGLLAHAVLHRAEPLAGGGDAPAVGQVAAGGQRHAHDGLAGREEGEVDREVGRRAGVGLHVGVLDAEQRLGPLDRQRLDLVDDLLALVVALARSSPRSTCWSAPSRWPRAPPPRRSSPTRSGAPSRAGARSRPRRGRRPRGRRGAGPGRVGALCWLARSWDERSHLRRRSSRRHRARSKVWSGRCRGDQVPGLRGQRAQQLPVAPPGAERWSPGGRPGGRGSAGPPGPAARAAVAPPAASRRPGCTQREQPAAAGAARPSPSSARLVSPDSIRLDRAVRGTDARDRASSRCERSAIVAAPGAAAPSRGELRASVAVPQSLMAGGRASTRVVDAAAVSVDGPVPTRTGACGRQAADHTRVSAARTGVSASRVRHCAATCGAPPCGSATGVQAEVAAVGSATGGCAARWAGRGAGAAASRAGHGGVVAGEDELRRPRGRRPGAPT